MAISIIVPTFEGRELVSSLFGSLGQVVFGDDDEVIVVDGASEDGTKELVEGVAGDSSVTVKFVGLEKNLGFSGNVNAGLAVAAVANDVVILNNDVLISDPEVFSRLEEVAGELAWVGILSPLVLDQRGGIQALGAAVLPFSHDGRNLCRGQRWSGQFAGLRSSMYVPFVCAFIKREVLEKLRGLDDGYFAYFEDVDFCLRAFEEGWLSATLTETEIVHLGPGTTSQKTGAALSIYARSKERFEERWAEFLWSTWQEEVVVVGGLGYATGFGVWCRRAMRAMLEAGVLTYFQPGRASVHLDHPSPEPWTRDCQRHFGDQDMVQIIIEHADRFARCSGRYKIGWSMCEVEPWPQRWLEGCRWVDEVWVPTEHERKVLLSSGVEREVVVMPLGVDGGYYHPGRAPWPQRPAVEFCFVSVFLWCIRKNPDMLIQAFREEFSRDESVALFIKTGTPDGAETLRFQTRWWMRKTGPPVMILTDPIQDDEMGRIYTMADCFVLPTSGEGWCLPALEALACGVPVITTGWGAPLEWGSAPDGKPLPGMHFLDYSLMDPRREIAAWAGSQWAWPDVDHLRALMREAYEKRDEWKGQAEMGSLIVRDRLSWERVGLRIRKRLSEIG